MDPPGNLPVPGIKPTSLKSPALTGGIFTTSSTWEAPTDQNTWVYFIFKAFTVKNTLIRYQIYTQYTSVSCIPQSRGNVCVLSVQGLFLLRMHFAKVISKQWFPGEGLQVILRSQCTGRKGWLRNRSVVTAGCSVYCEIFKQVGECIIPSTRSSVPGHTHTHTRAILYVTQPLVNISMGSLLCHALQRLLLTLMFVALVFLWKSWINLSKS